MINTDQPKDEEMDPRRSNDGPTAATMPRVVIESPFGTRAEDGSRCTPDEIARNMRYLDRCIQHSLSLGEAPYASHGFFTSKGRLDDSKPEQRKQGIEAGLAWGAVAELVAIYADHGVTEGMTQGIIRHEQNGVEMSYRWIGEEPLHT
jgi:hypothetical protein